MIHAIQTLDKCGYYLIQWFEILFLIRDLFTMSLSTCLCTFISCVLLLAKPAAASDYTVLPPISEASLEAHFRALPRLRQMLEDKSMQLGNHLYIRIFKQTNELELWLQRDGERYELFRTYIICHRSGTLGPKQETGDKQSPEGFYSITRGQMNPWSKFHLSFNLGYPNEYDQAYNRSGSALMIHGRCSSAGCFAMTDYYMDEIYTLANAALANEQTAFQVHIFPFKMTETNMKRHRYSKWIGFWTNLKKGYDLFEKHHLVPYITVENKNYVFSHQYNRAIARISP